MPTEVGQFDAATHTYTLDGCPVPSITQMLEAAGKVKGGRFYTEAGRDRGTNVHRLTLDYDLGALDLDDVVSRHRGYLLGWAKASAFLAPSWRALEEPFVHPLGFGGTPDRGGVALKLESVLEIKTGDVEAWHGLQLALQAILVGHHWHIRPEAIARWAVYLRANGRFKLMQFEDRAELNEARGIIRKHGRV